MEGHGAHIELAARDATIVLAVHGALDGPSVRLLEAAIDAAVAERWQVVRVDLGAVGRITADGAAALSGVLTKYREADRRLVYQAPTSAGQSALLAAYAT